MPPLMLSTDEAVAMTLALALSGPAASDSPAPSQTALAKLLHVLPRGVAAEVHKVLDAVTPPVASPHRPAAEPAPVATLASGVVERRRCRIRHRGADGTTTVRELNPYGLAAVWGSLYVHGWCHLRQARRTFRVDRIDRVDLLDRPFRMPAGLDVAAAVERSLALSHPEWAVSLLLHGPVADVEPWIPRFLGVCEAVDATTTRVHSSTSNPDYFVLRISDHPFAMTVEEPDELRAAFARAAERFAATARPPRLAPGRVPRAAATSEEAIRSAAGG
jgi:predicted DNA-binding transcriptional regulator YafY